MTYTEQSKHVAHPNVVSFFNTTDAHTPVCTHSFPRAPLLGSFIRPTTRQQCYVVTASPARNPDSKYQAWGHSSVVDPWGKVVATTEHGSAMVVAEVDVGRVTEVRKSIPVSLQKRSDLYRLELPS